MAGHGGPAHRRRQPGCAVGCSLAGGEVVVHRLNPVPPSSGSIVPVGHWVVDEYGGGDFDADVMWMMGAEESSLRLGSRGWARCLSSAGMHWEHALVGPCETMSMTPSTAEMDAGCLPMFGNSPSSPRSVPLTPRSPPWVRERPSSGATRPSRRKGSITPSARSMERARPWRFSNSGFLIHPTCSGMPPRTACPSRGVGRHQWFLNGTLLDAEGATLEAPAAGNYTLTAVDPSTGCTVSTSGAVGCPGDLDADQVVGVSDVLLLLGGFGCSGECGVADVNSDGVVNVTDVLFLLGLFGSIC